MTLGRLLELLNAEKQGHQIMKKTTLKWREYGERCEEVKLSECDLSDFVNEDTDDVWIEFFIKHVEYSEYAEHKQGR